MVGIVSGNTLGLNLGSLAALGARGRIGTAEQGRAGERTYVNVATGDLVLQDQDTSLVGVGSLAAAVRTYNSQGLLTGWRETPVKSVVKVGTLLRRTDVDGSVCDYIWNGTRRVYEAKTAPGSVQDTMIHDASGTYTWTDRSTGAKETYQGSGSGLIVSSTDTNGNTLTYAYDASERLWHIDNSNGDALWYTYGTLADGRKTVQIGAQVSGVLRNEVKYTYDTQGRLQEVTIDLDPEKKLPPEAKGAASYKTVYAYEGTSNRISQVSQSDGTKLTLTYVQVNGTYRVETVTDGEGATTKFAYDAAVGASPTLYATAHRTTRVTDPLGVVTAYDSDASGQLLGIRSAVTAANPNGQRWVKYTYNALGDVATVSDSLGSTVTLSYDVYGNLLTQTDTAGNCVTWGYNSRNFPRRQTVNRVPADVAMAATAGETTRYGWDPDRDLLRFVVDATGRVTEHRYDANGQRLCTITYTGALYDLSALGVEENGPTAAELATWAAALDQSKTQRTDYAYDVRGQLMSATTYAGVDASGNGVAATAQTTHYVYDEHGQLLHTWSATGQSDTTYVRDGLGRVAVVVSKTKDGSAPVTTTTLYDDTNATTTVTLSNGLVTKTTYDRAGRLIGLVQSGRDITTGTTRYFYDRDGRLVMTEDPTGKRSWKLYDDLGNQVADVDATGHLTEYVHDADGRLTQTIRYATAVDTALLVDANGKPTASPADPNAARVTLAQIRVADPAKDEKSWTLYDASGRLAWQVDAFGYVTETQYDGASRVIGTRRYATAVDTAGLGDGAGVRFVPAGGTETNVTVNGDVAVVRTRVLPATVADSDRTTTRIYDAAGLLIGIVDAKGYLTEYAYDAAGREILTTAYAAARKEFDTSSWTTLLEAARAAHSVAGLRPDPVVPATEPEAIRTYTTYNARGQVAGKVDGGGYLTEFVYDETGHETRIIRYSDPVKASVPRSSQIDELRPASDPNAQTTVRTWDGLGRLSTEKNAEGTVTSYEYDAMSRVTSKTVALGTKDQRTLLAHYDAMGRLSAELSAEGAKKLTGNQTQPEVDAIWAQYGTSYTYDSAGRRTSSTDAKGNRTLYYYDDAGRLRFTIDAEGDVKETTYNALGHVETATQFAVSIDKQELPRLGGGLLSADNAPAGKLSVAELLEQARHGLDAQGLPGQNSTSIFRYDTRGNVVETTDPTNRIVTSEWNEFGELERTREMSGDELETVTRYFRDRLGQVDEVMNYVTGKEFVPMGWSASKYDAYGRVTESTDRNGNVAITTYDALGHIITVEDPTHQLRRTTWDAFGRVLTQTDALNQTTSYTYDDAARSVTVTTPEGVKVTTTHNREGQTETVVRWDGVVRLDGTRTPVGDQEDRTTYVYDADGHVKSVTTPLTTTSSVYDEAGRLTDTFDANGNKVHYTYDAASRVLSRTVDPNGLALTTSYQYDAKGQAYLVTDANGVVTRFTFDLNGKVLTQLVDPGGLGLRTTYRYDSRGNVVFVMTPSGNFTEYQYDGGNRRVATILHNVVGTSAERYGYDRNGNLAWRDDGNGNHSVFAYDADNRLVYSVDGAGNVKKNEYDANGRVVAVISYVSPLTGYSRFGGPGGDKTGTVLGVDASWPNGYGPTSIADVEARLVTSSGEYGDVVERRVFDRDGRVKFTVDGTGGVVEFTYDAKGNVIERLSYATKISILDWNPSAGSTPTEKLAFLQRFLKRDPEHDLRVQTAYDLLNRPVATVDARGAVTLNVYDANGNVIVEVAPAATTLPVSVPPTDPGFADALVSAAQLVRDPARDRCVRNVYDAANRLVWTVAGNGAVTERVYDKDRMVKRIAYAKTVNAEAKAFQLVDLRHERTPFTAEFLKAAVTLGDYGGSVVASDGSSVDTSYGGTVSGGPVLQDRVEQFAYDRAGRLTFRVAADGAVTRQVYDLNGNVALRCAFRYPRAVPLARWAAPSDAELAVQFAVGEARIEGFVYDAANRLQYTVSADGAITQNDYDGAGNVVATTRYGGRTQACYEIVPANVADVAEALRTGVKESIAHADTLTPDRTKLYAYDAAGRLAYTVAVTRVETGRDSNGPVYAPRGVVESQDFDGAGRVVSRTQYESAITNVHHGMTGSELQASSELANSLIRRTWYDVDAAGRLRLVRDPKGYTERYWYDALGNLSTYEDKNLNTWNYDYDAAGQRVRERSPEVKRVEVSMSGNEARSIELVERLVTETVYDALGNITLRTEAVGTADQRITSYGYDQVGRRVATVHPQVTVGGGQPTELTSRVRYDAFGDAVERIDTAGVSSYAAYDQIGRVTYQIDAEGYVTGYSYERTAIGELVTQTRYAHAPTLALDGDAPTTGEISDALQAVDHAKDRVRKTQHDHMGRVVLVQDFEGTGASVGASVKNTYDTFGDLVQVSTLVDLSPETWSTVTHYYDQRGLEIATVDPLGYLTEQTYDAAGHVLTRTRHAEPSRYWWRDEFGAPSSNPKDRVETFEYDLNGRLTAANDANGITELYGYDNAGNRTAYTNKKGYTWYYKYDALGRMVQETTPPVSLSSATLVDGNIALRRPDLAPVVTKLGYDAFGNVTSRTEAAGRVEERTTRFVYDAWNRQVKTILPPVEVYSGEMGSTLTLKSASGDTSRAEITQTLVTTVDYDEAGNAVIGTDAAGCKTLKVYDRAGRVAYEIDPDGYVTRYDRNAFGEVTTLTRYANPAYANVYRVGPAPRKAAVDEVMSRSASAQDRAITTEYDDLGRVKKVVQPKAWANDEYAPETDYEYDLAGRVRQTSSRIDATRWATTTYIFDLKGQQTAIIDAENYVTTQQYDGFGQVSRRTEHASWVTSYTTRDVTLPASSGKDRTVEYAYDRLGRKISETRIDVEYVDTAGLEDALRAAGQGAQAALEGRFVGARPWDRPAVVRGDLTTTYGYDAVGNQIRVTDALGNSTYSYFDALGRMCAITAPTRVGSVDGGLTSTTVTPLTTFDRDAHGNVVRKIEWARGAETLPVPADSRVAVNAIGTHIYPSPTFDYDTGAVPTASVDPGGRDRATLTAYDRRGNTVQVRDAAGFDHYMSYDESGRLAKLWQTVSGYDPDFGRLKTFTQFTVLHYDKRGNQTSITTPGSSTTRDADHAVKVLSAQDQAPVITEQTYNAFGEVIERVTWASNQERPDRASSEWFEYDNAGRMWRTNSGGVVKVTKHDLLGRVTAEIVSAGSNDSRYDLGEDLGSLANFGEVLALANSRPQRVRQTDYELDKLGRVVTQALPSREYTVHSAGWDPEYADFKCDPESFRPVIRKTFDRWGNVLTIRDAVNTDPKSWDFNTSGYPTFEYDKNNRLINQDGAYGTYVYYDQLGRQVAVQDANGHVNAQLWDAASQLLKEIHADVGIDEDRGKFVGIVTHTYDAFGDQVQLTDAMGNRTTYGYDELGRNTTISSDPVTVGEVLWADWVQKKTTADGRVYDGRLSGGTKTTTEVITTKKVYDQLGRVYEQVDGEGCVTSYAFDLRGNIVGTRKPMGQVTQSSFDVGGRQIGQVNPGFLGVRDFETWAYDSFGKLKLHRDLGGGVHSYAYDHAGQLILQDDRRDSSVLASQSVQYFYDAAGQMVRIESVEDRHDASNNLQTAYKTTSYAYDAAGRHAIERVWVSDPALSPLHPFLEDHTLSYDDRGRLRSVKEHLGGFTENPRVNAIELKNTYDAVGNLVEQATREADSTLRVNTGKYTYHYDAMNRQIDLEGEIADQDLRRVRSERHYLKYDRNGNRTADITDGQQLVLEPHSTRNGGTFWTWKVQNGLVAHYYEYDSLNRLAYVSLGTLDDASQITKSLPYASRMKVETRVYDRASRTVYSGPGDLVSNTYRNAAAEAAKQGYVVDGARGPVTAYDANGRVIATQTRFATGEFDNEVLYFDGHAEPENSSYDSNGNVRKYLTFQSNYGNGNWITSFVDSFDNNKTVQVSQTAMTVTTEKGEGYLESTVTALLNDYVDRIGTTRKTYDANGFLAKFEDLTKPEVNKEFFNDTSGHILLKKQGASYSAFELVANGNVLNVYYSSDNTPHTNLNYQPITNAYPAAAVGAFEVRAGDTLESVALSAYGDVSLWYLIADANGVSSNADLRVGQTLQIPTRLAGTHNTAETFKPYDPSSLIGNTSPNIPAAKPKHDKWRIWKVIAVAVNQVVATVVVGYFCGPVVGALAGEMTGQLWGMALGLRKEFDVRALVIAGIRGAVTWGVGSALQAGTSAGVEVAAEASAAEEAAAEAAQAAQAAAMEGALPQAALAAWKAGVSDALTQAIAVATHLQKSFNWQQVALAEVGAATSSLTASAVGWDGSGFSDGAKAAGRVARDTVAGMASGVVTSSMRGGRVDIEMIAADAFGNALGNVLGEAMRPKAALPEGSSRGFGEKDRAAQERDAATDVGSGDAAPGTSDAEERSRLMREYGYTEEELNRWGPPVAAVGVAAGFGIPDSSYPLGDSGGGSGTGSGTGNAVGPYPLQDSGGGAELGTAGWSPEPVVTAVPATANAASGGEPLGAGDRAAEKDFIRQTLGSDAPPPSAEDLERAQGILHRYGFRTGALESEFAGQQLTVDQKSARLSGRGEASLPYTRASAEAFLGAADTELDDRHALFAAPNGGTIKRVVDGVEHKITISFDTNSGRLGQGVGVSFEEAKAKVNWRVYQGVIDAGLATPGLQSLEINGVWRPTHGFFHSYFSQSTAFSSAQARQQAKSQTLSEAGMPPPIPGQDAVWSPIHPAGKGVDIYRINGSHNLVDRPKNAAGDAKPQPEVLRQFSFNLKSQPGEEQVLQPWMQYKAAAGGDRQQLGNEFWSNIRSTEGEKRHRNHLHYTRY